MGSPQIIERAITSLRPYARNARTHSRKQIAQITRSIERFGFTNPVLVSDDGEIIAGHGRVEAAKSLGWKTVPTIALSHLSETERRAYVLADNKLALNAGWDKEILAIELQALVDLEFDVELTGFSLAEIDFAIEEAGEADPGGVDAPEDAVEYASGTPVSRFGDIWHLGRHRLLCGDARSAVDFEALMDGARADLVFTDPPYNVKIDGNVCGLGTVRHREFAFASGEMNRAQFTAFLTETLGNIASVMRDGAIAYPVERHPPRLLTISATVLELLVEGALVRLRIDQPLQRESASFARDLQFNLRLLREAAGNAHIFDADLSDDEFARIQQVDWELPPAGSAERVLAHLEARKPVDPAKLAVARERLEALERLGHDGFIVGTGRFARYFGARFGERLVALENLEYGNALYLFEENWEQLTRLSRTELIRRRDASVHRIPHLPGWQSAIRKLVRSI